MTISLGERTADTVRTYFEKAQDPSIKAVLPQKAKTVEEALEDFEKTLLPGASSFGRTVLADGIYVGDVWCYCIDPDDEPNAMLSCCIFDKDLWNQGVGSGAVRQFLQEACTKYSLRTVGAFTYADNAASIRVLEKNGFRMMEEFTEDGQLSLYYQLDNDEEQED